MKRLITLGVLFIVVAVIGIYTFGGIVVGGAIEMGIETIVPRLTKSPVQMDKLRINPLTGTGTIHGFFMGNPEGFKSDHAFKCERIHLEIKMSSVFSDHIVIEAFHVIEPQFIYERKLTTSNFKEILKNLEGEQDPNEDKDEPEDKESVKIEIQDFLVDHAKVSMSMVGMTVPLELNPIELENIGTEEDGLPSEKVAFKVMTEVFKKVVGAVATSPLKLVPGGKE